MRKLLVFLFLMSSVSFVGGEEKTDIGYIMLWLSVFGLIIAGIAAYKFCGFLDEKAAEIFNKIKNRPKKFSA